MPTSSRVLDLDLDFFLRRVPRREPGARRPNAASPVWRPQEVRWFLQERCQLARSGGAPLHVVEHHHEAFDVVHDALQRGALRPGMHWVHVDAHADLGMSNDGHRYVATSLMDLPVTTRPWRIDRTKLRPGNYLICLAACGWLGAVDYVVHPHRYHGDHLAHDDRMPCYFRHQCADSERLELARYDAGALHFADPQHFGYGVRLCADAAPDITLPFRTVPAWRWHNDTRFDAVIVARSPDYTPPAVDAFIDIVREILA